jgi:mannosidase alpha-like ER degradation enhancer 2
LTRRPVFYEKAKRALVEIYQRRSAIGLVGTWINVETGQWVDTDSHISGAIDSYYEYLLKCWLLFGDEDCHRMWKDSIAAINKHLADRLMRCEEVHDKNLPGGHAWATWTELWYGHADMNTGRRTAQAYGALDAFFPAVLALSGDLGSARQLQNSSFKMWQLHDIESEEINYQEMKTTEPGYPLRPEIVESAYYLYHYSRAWGRVAEAHKYQQMGRQMFADFVKYCRTVEGYAALKSVITKEQTDAMQSFVFAETFKYFYLLFAPPQTLDFDRVIFNTEAHPLRRQKVVRARSGVHRVS